MNRISRLTALLLALMITFSMFATAETAYQIGGMTQEQWETLVKGAEKTLYTIDEGDSGKEVVPANPEPPERSDYYPYTDGVAEALTDEEISCQITASGVAVLTNAAAGQWQMKIGSVWANIAGETGDSLSVTGAMLNGMPSAEVRKALEPKNETTGEYSAFTATATVEIVEAGTPALFSVTRASSFAEDAATDASNTVPAPYGLERANAANTYTVVINYRFKDGTTAAGSWGSSLGAGTGLTQTVTNPMVVGYKPTTVSINPPDAAGITYTPATVAAADDAANSIKIGDVTDPGSVNLNIASIERHITVTVTYEPTYVDYTVIHKRQNVDNDNYTEYERITERGLTGSLVPNQDIARTYEGFYSLLYEQPEIAANGSTVVEISYDRYYYLISFELGGGYGVDPVYGRYGTPVSIAEPTRAGYDFAGWDKTVPATIPDEHMVITASWTPTTANYTVVYWFEKADSTNSNLKTNYSSVHVVTVPNAATESTVTSDSRPDITTFGNAVINALNEHPKHFTRYTNTDAVADSELEGTYTVAGDGSTIVNVYYTRKAYTIRFYYMRSRTNGTDYEVPSDYGRRLENAVWNYDEYRDYPKVKAEYAHMAGYQDLTINRETHRYYYLELTAKYNSDLSDKWPNLPLEYDNGSNYHDRTQNSWAIHGDAPYYNQVGNTKSFKGIYTRFDDALIPASSTDTILDIPNGFVTYFVSYWGRNQDHFLYNIFFDVVPGDVLPEGAVTKTYGGKTYVQVAQNEALSGSGYNGQNAPSYEGAKNVAKQNPNKGNGDTNNPIHVDFYYERLKYDLIYMSNGEQVKKEEVPFGAQMERYLNPLSADFAPNDYSYFDGWYTAETCVPESKYVFADSTMPANNVTLYAKWSPNTYKVRFFLTEALMETGLDANVYRPTMAEDKQAIFTDIPHGTQIDQEFVDAHLDYNAMTVNGGVFHPYTFVAWFYYDENGVKQPFEPATQITQDLDAFAEWSSSVLMSYTIRYAVPKKNADGSYVLDDDGNRVVDYYIADADTGSALAGTSKTFEAKGGTDLYADYQTGCFPETESHTLKFDVEQAQIGAEYTFWYTDKVKVPYTVYYVTETQNAGNSLTPVTIGGKNYYQLLQSKTVSDNEDVIVTENFEVVPGYMPDDFQKRLIVTNDGNADNDVIIFIYTKDEQHAYYRVTHYIENLAKDAAGNTTWTEYTSSQIVGNIGTDATTQYNDDPLEIQGFEFKNQEYSAGSNPPVSGSPDRTALTEAGMQINLYYTRRLYPYKVQYLLENTTTSLAPDKAGKDVVGRYEETVTENALDIENYVLVGDAQQSLTIRIEEGVEPRLNIITFYYREKQVTLNYVAVCPDDADAADFGTVTPEEESLSILSGVAYGSEASAGKYYAFAGWYSDAACTEAALLTAEAKYIPTKAAGEPWTDGTTFYAKFVWNVADLSITKTVADSASGVAAPTDDVFTLTVELPKGEYDYNGTLGSSGKLIVAQDNQPVTLTIKAGERITIEDIVAGSAYKVEEINVPSYFRASPAVEGTIATENNTAAVTNTYLTGDLSITKQIVEQEGFAVPEGVTFTFNVTLTGPHLGNSIRVSIDGAEAQPTALTDNVLTFTLKDDQTAILKDLPAGTVYSVVETVPDNFTVQYDEHASGTMDDDGESTVVINHYPARYGELKVEKSGLKDNESAIVDVEITTNQTTVTYTFVLNNANPSATITNILVGSAYTVSERTGWTWLYSKTPQYANRSGYVGDVLTICTILNHSYSDKWMHDESYVVNHFGNGEKSGVNN